MQCEHSMSKWYEWNEETLSLGDRFYIIHNRLKQNAFKNFVSV